MTAFWSLIAAAIAFVGTHFLLSHPLRGPLVARIGETAFSILYSIVAIATLAWMVVAYRAVPAEDFLWNVGDGLWAVVTILMLLAAMLFMGSLVRNPALPGPATPVPTEPKGVFAITRHPMMWSFALWAACHIAVYPMPANIVLASAIIVLALIGAALQDRKKEQLRPGAWPAWESRTSFLPFGAILNGRARLGGFGMHTLAGGTVVWLAATWAHIPLSGWPAGIWKWI